MEPIYGFPETYSCRYNLPLAKYRCQRIVAHSANFFDFSEIIQEKGIRNVLLSGYFQSYNFLKNYTEKIRNEWLKVSSELLPLRNESSIVVHVRAEYPSCYFIPFEFYQIALSIAKYDQVYICTDNPDHPYLRNFDSYNPIIVSTRNFQDSIVRRSHDEICALNIDDFLFMMSFDKIIYGVSTYSWWAAFLSDAKEIYAPYDDRFNYLKVDEDRYHYIPIKVGL